MNLFAEIIRDYSGPKLDEESDFHFLNRSAKLEVERVRQLLEEWFSHYPKEHNDRLRGDICSNRNENHRSAIFELLLHELLLHLGCTVEIHPSLDSSDKRPDFFVTEPDGSSVYIEAFVLMQWSREEEGEKRRIARVVDGINRKVRSKQYFLYIDIKRSDKSNPSINRIAKFLEEQLAACNYEELLRLAETKNTRLFPHWRWAESGWVIVFEPIPKKRETTNRYAKRIIGMGPIEGGWLNTGSRLRRVLLEKLKKYQNLCVPIIIAINLPVFLSDLEDVEDVLFGDQALQVEVTPEGPRRSRMIRKRNGVWLSSKGSRHTQNCALLVSYNFSPWSILQTRLQLFHHPWAEEPYAGRLNQLPQWKLLGSGERSLIDGASIGSIIHLPAGWPEVAQP